jgi:hypothetical protein
VVDRAGGGDLPVVDGRDGPAVPLVGRRLLAAVLAMLAHGRRIVGDAGLVAA